MVSGYTVGRQYISANVCKHSLETKQNKIPGAQTKSKELRIRNGVFMETQGKELCNPLLIRAVITAPHSNRSAMQETSFNINRYNLPKNFNTFARKNIYCF